MPFSSALGGSTSMGSDFEGSLGRSSLEPFPLPFFSSVSLCSDDSGDTTRYLTEQHKTLNLHMRTSQLEKVI